MNEWSRFIRENFDKLLLCFIFMYCSGLVIHLTHDSRDSDLILWSRELAGTVLGALLGLITGHALAARTTSVTSGNPPSSIVTTENK